MHAYIHRHLSIVLEVDHFGGFVRETQTAERQRGHRIPAIYHSDMRVLELLLAVCIVITVLHSAPCCGRPRTAYEFAATVKQLQSTNKSDRETENTNENSEIIFKKKFLNTGRYEGTTIVHETRPHRSRLSHSSKHRLLLLVLLLLL